LMSYSSACSAGESFSTSDIVFFLQKFFGREVRDASRFRPENLS